MKIKRKIFSIFLLFFQFAYADDADLTPEDQSLLYQKGVYLLYQDRDYVQAERFLREAERLGNIDAKYDLARLYDIQGVDNQTIVSLLQEAANYGNVNALVWLGKIYQYGRKGILKNIIKTKNCFEQAASKGSTEAIQLLENLNANQKKVHLKDEIKWLELKIKDDDVSAMVELAQLYENLNDDEKSLKYYLLAAQKNEMNAQEKVGMFFLQGRGCEKNPEKAFFWLLESAKNGNPTAQRQISYLYVSHLGKLPEGYAWLVLSLSSMFPNADNLVAVSPDLENLMKVMTLDDLKKGQDFANEYLLLVKNNKK